MAKKPTKEELRQALVDSYFADDSIDDPFLADAKKRISARQEAASRPDFSNVEEGFGTSEIDEEPSFLRGLFDDIVGIQQATQDAGIGGLKRTLGGVGFVGADDGLPTPFGFLTDMVPEEAKERGREFYGDLFQTGQKETEAVTKALDQSLNFEASKFIAEPVTDVAGSPSSLASVLGGGVGAVVPALDVYGQEYVEARLAGLEKGEAQARAGLHAGVEGMIERIPAGQFLGKIPGLEKLLGREAAEKLSSDAAKTAIRVGRTSGGEAVEEGLTTLAQLGVDKTIAETTSKESLREFTNDKLPEDITGVWDATWRSMKAGAVGGGALSAPIERVKIAAERGKLVSDMLGANADQRGQLKLKKTAEEEAGKALAEGRDLFGVVPQQLGEEDRLRAVAEQDNEENDKQAILRNRVAALDSRISEEKTNLQTLEDTKFKALMNAEAGDSFEKFDENKVKRTKDWIKSAEQARERLVKQINPKQAQLFTTEQAPVPTKPVKTDGIIPTKDPDKYYDPEGKLRSRTQDRTIGDAAIAIKKDKAEQEKARIKAYEDARTKERSRLVTESRGKEDGERIEFVATKLAEWDRANPKGEFQLPVSPKKKTAAKPVLTRSKPAEIVQETEEEEVSTEGLKSVEDLKKALSKPLTQQVRDVPKTDTKASDVLGTLTEKMGGGDAKKIAKLIADKNMVVVDDVSELPGNAQERGAGFYDGDKTYIVANRVNKKNIMGEVLSIAAHETKHAADLAGKPELKASLGGFIGKSANAQLKRKIEGLAKVDKGVAAVVEAAKKGSNKATYDLELPAYFINYARAKRDQKGAVARLAGNIVSAVRTKFGGGDISLDDVAYMSDKLLKEVAVAGDRMVTKIDTPLPMFISKGRGKIEASLKGRMYESVDGAIKYEIADDNSRMADLSIEDRNNPNKVWYVGEVLQHEDLYEELPALRTVRVVFVNDPQQAFRAEFIPNNKLIRINLAHTGEPNGFSYGGQTHRSLLHELQHAAQQLSGTTRGSSTDRFIDKQRTGQLETALRASDEMLDRAIEEGNPQKIGAVMTQRRKFFDLLEKEYDNAFNNYQSVLGEHEARATADRLTLNQRQRDKQVGDMESLYVMDTGKILDANGRILVSKEDVQGLPDYILAFNPDFLAGALDGMQNKTNRLTTVLKTQFKGFGGLDRKLGVMKEEADARAALSAHRAMNYYARINEGVSILARRGVKDGTYKNADEGRKAINDMIRGRLEAISKIEDPHRREAALGAISREYPELKALVEAITESTELSRRILLQMIEDIPNPTPKELKEMNTIYNNMFRYSTRLYAAFQGEPGRERSRRLVNEYRHAKDALAKRGVVPEKFRESFETYTKGLKYIIDHDITIPEDEVLDAMKQDRIDQLFDTWVQDGAARTKILAKAQAKAEGMSDASARLYAREVMVEKLRQRREEISDTEYEAAAHDVIRGMLELEESTSPFASYYRGFKQDRGILVEREHIDPAIRDLLGEVTDPATRLAITVAKQGELVARTRLLLDMKEKGEGKWVMPAVDARLPGNEKFSAALDGESWGPLNGYRATPEVHRTIGETVEMIQSLTDALAKSYQNTGAFRDKAMMVGGRGITKGAGAAKVMGVVFEPFGMLMNFIGSFAVPLANGVVNPKYYGKGILTGLEVVADTMYDGKGKLSAEFEDAVRWGILDSARVQEIRRTPQEFVRELISKKPKSVKWLKKYTARAGHTAIEIFAMADAWAKITAFQQRTDVLRDFYKAEGIEKTDDEIKSEAADQIKDTNITYARTIAAVRNVESFGLTTFLPYFYSVPRALSYGYIQAGKDLIRSYYATSAKGKRIMAQQGIQRLVGNSVATMGVISLLKAIASMVNDDEEKLEEIKKLMTEDARFAESIYLGKDSEGNPLFARLSRVDAYGPVNDALRVVLDDSLDPDEKAKYTIKMIKDLLFLNRFTKSAGVAVGDYLTPVTEMSIKDKNTRLERIAPKVMENVKDWIIAMPTVDNSDANSMLAVLDSFSPGWLDALDPANPRVKDQVKDGAGDLGDMLIFMGGRLDRADPGLASFVAGAKVEQAQADGRGRIAKGIAAGRSDETLEKLFLDAAGKEHDAMREAADVYSGMVNGLGLTPKQASEILKDDGDLSTVEVAAIRQGRVTGDAEEWINNSSVLSKKSMTQRNAGARPEDAEEIKERSEAFRKKMKALGYKVRE